MSDSLDIHHYAVCLMLIMAALTCVTLLFIPAPYGRHLSTTWGPTISTRSSWILMETPAVVLFLAIYSIGNLSNAALPLIFLFMWQFH